MDKKIFLVTTDTKHNGTATQIAYSGIFVNGGDPNARDLLNETEIDVMEFLADDDSGCVKCGCVTGCIEQTFSTKDQRLLAEHGLNTRFEF